MSEISNQLRNEIEQLEVKLERLRERLDKADANDVHSQGELAQAISKIVTELETLERFKARYGY